MKKALALILALVMCLCLCACGENTPTTTDGSTTNNDPTGTSVPTTTNSTQAQPLADFDILGEWVIVDDGMSVITFNEDGTCIKEGEQAVKYKVEADIAVLTIYYSTPQSYNIEKFGEHYRMTGEHFLLREADELGIEEVVKSIKYQKVLELIAKLDLFDRYNKLEIMAEAYELLVDLGDYKDAAELLTDFEECTIHTNDTPSGLNFTIYNGNEDAIAYANYYLGASSSIYCCTYEYNEDGLLLKISGLSQWGTFSYTTYEYNEAGKITKEYLEAVDDFAFYKQYTTTYIYDELGRLIKETFYIKENCETEILYTYNDNNELVEKVETRGVDQYKYTYIYDENSNLIQERCIDLETQCVIDQYTYSYDNTGRLVSERDEDGLERTYSYDQNGLLVEDASDQPDGTKVIGVYQYDENGKCIKYEVLIQQLDGTQTINTTYTYSTIYFYLPSLR